MRRYATEGSNPGLADFARDHRGPTRHSAPDGSATHTPEPCLGQLRVWAQQLKSLLGALLEEARAARLCVRDNATLFSAPPFGEHPHAGSRNLRERRLAKVLYTRALEPYP